MVEKGLHEAFSHGPTDRCAATAWATPRMIPFSNALHDATFVELGRNSLCYSARTSPAEREHFSFQTQIPRDKELRPRNA